MDHIGPCRGIPLNPIKSAPPQKRDIMVKVRLTEDELKTLKAPLMENGKSKRGLSEEIRTRLFRRKSKTGNNIPSAVEF